jgi:hypothetical protein
LQILPIIAIVSAQEFGEPSRVSNRVETPSDRVAQPGSSRRSARRVRQKIMSQPLRKALPAKIIPAENVRIMRQPQESDAAEPIPEAAVPAEHHVPGHEPEVILLKDGVRVKTIVVKCKCGQVICLDCEF